MTGPQLPQPPLARRPNQTRARIVAIVVLALAAGLIGASLYLGRNEASGAKVGDCVAQTGENSLTRVTCADPKARYVVVGRVDDRDEIDASLNACDPYKDKGAMQAYWEGKDGQKGFVLCLARK